MSSMFSSERRQTKEASDDNQRADEGRPRAALPATVEADVARHRSTRRTSPTGSRGHPRLVLQSASEEQESSKVARLRFRKLLDFVLCGSNIFQEFIAVWNIRKRVWNIRKRLCIIYAVYDILPYGMLHMTDFIDIVLRADM